MKILTSDLVKNIIENYKENLLFGRWITVSNIEKVFSNFQNSSKLSISNIGASEENRPIYQIDLGNGPKKILIWTQMHGNESTGTKAVFDLLNYFNTSDDIIVSKMLSGCTIKIIPILNPDGAEYYTRVNGKKVDLNRDAVDRKAKESQLLRNVLEEFNPHFSFNLHDQRTIFGVAGTKNPATISFLAPSEEASRKITSGRKTTMNVIVAMNTLLQQFIPNHVGRYTDEFYPTATGDNFQKLGYATILIESGHYKDDYDREEVRKFTFISLLQGIYHIASASEFKTYKAYLEIPNNNESFRDILHVYSNKPNEAFQYKEVLVNNGVDFIPEVVFDDISDLFFHKEIDFVR
tara:strand:+ start:4538 stop:5587 length:1050 start_codon:yes stop_codon:yes gene_type:complete